MKIRLFLMLVGVLVCAALGMSDGLSAMSFQMATAFTVLQFIKPYLPKPSHGISGLAGCDADPAEQLQQLTKELGDAKATLTKQQVELKDAHKQVMDSIANQQKLEKTNQENIDKAIALANDQGLLVKELAQKMDDVAKSMTEPRPAHNVRSMLTKELEVNKEKYDALKAREGKSLKLVLKEITSAEAAGLLRDPYVDTLVSMERRPLRIRDLLTVVPVQSDSVKYAKQSVRTNLAKIVAEGTAKPYSQYAWVNQTASIETIAHLAKLTLQAIADAPRLVAEVESEMRYGLTFAEEAEILNGDGTTGHLDGLVHQATAYAVPAGVTTANVLTPVDMLRVAILQIHLAFASPDGHVLNPIDMANMEMLRRDPDKGGGYLFGNPDADTGVSRLWRLPVVESASMPIGDFLTGAFKYSASLYDREGVQVLISTENDTDFENNQATMRCESRIGLGVRRPYGLVTGSFSGS